MRPRSARLLRLYPRRWRDRYGDEMAAVLAARPPDLGARLDIARGALDAWFFDQATIDASGFDDVILEQAWRAPDGSLLSEVDAMALVTDDPEVDPWQWLADRGYDTVSLGVTGETARSWLPLEVGGTSLVGLGLVAGAVLIVDRRRPT